MELAALLEVLRQLHVELAGLVGGLAKLIVQLRSRYFAQLFLLLLACLFQLLLLGFQVVLLPYVELVDRLEFRDFQIEFVDPNNQIASFTYSS